MTSLKLVWTSAVCVALSLWTACDSGSTSPEAKAAVSFGTLADSRDGQSYKTVQIGNQVWMAENLNYVFLSSTDGLDSGSFCYNDSLVYCEKYGRLYTWAAANVSCPAGWHLPSSDEWRVLFSTVGDSSSAGLDLKATSGWYGNLNGSDAYAFSMLPGGFRDVGGKYLHEQRVAFFWSSSEDSETFAYYTGFVLTSSQLDDSCIKRDYRSEALSVRCVKD